MNTETMLPPCSFCGAPIPPGNSFCGRCGRPVAPAPLGGQALPPQQPLSAPLAQPPVPPVVMQPSLPPPLSAPLMVQAPPKPSVWRGFKTWLLVTIVITVVGAIAAVAIPAYIVLHPSPGPTQLTTSSTHFARCAVGTSYDDSTGTLVEESTSFSMSDPVVQQSDEIELACWLNPNANPHAVTDDVEPGMTSTPGNPQTGEYDSAHQVYHNAVAASALGSGPPGPYTWTVFYGGEPEVAVHFQVTS